MRANRVISMFGTSENALKHVSSIVSSSVIGALSSDSVSSVEIVVATLEDFLTEVTTGVDSTGFGIDVSSSQMLKGADSIFSCRDGVRSSLKVVMSSAEALYCAVSATGSSVTNGELGPSSQLCSSTAVLATGFLLGVMLSSAISRSNERECSADMGDRLELRVEGDNGVRGMIGCWKTRVSTIAWVIVCTSKGSGT
jgi:hypothetical protein